MRPSPLSLRPVRDTQATATLHGLSAVIDWPCDTPEGCEEKHVFVLSTVVSADFGRLSGLECIVVLL